MRRHTNARPRPQLTLPDGDGETTELEPGTPTTSGRDHGTRAAAKRSPSRVTGRMYSQVHDIADAVESAEAHLARLHVPDHIRAALTAAADAHRADLAAARSAVPAAVSDPAVADEVKASLARLEVTARLLEPAAAALGYAVRDLAAATSTDEDVPAAVTDVQAGVTDVLIALSSDRPGQLSAAVARLRTIRGELSAA